ncbi:hypothetical protein ACHAXS_000096 [Conticribra weissflogii]
MIVGSDHAGDKQTRHSCTTIETGVFGAEFVAVKTGDDTMIDLRYELRIIGVGVDNAAVVYWNNMSIIKITSKPESTLNKKSSAV